MTEEEQAVWVRSTPGSVSPRRPTSLPARAYMEEDPTISSGIAKGELRRVPRRVPPRSLGELEVDDLARRSRDRLDVAAAPSTPRPSCRRPRPRRRARARTRPGRAARRQSRSGRGRRTRSGTGSQRRPSTCRPSVSISRTSSTRNMRTLTKGERSSLKRGPHEPGAVRAPQRGRASELDDGAQRRHIGLEAVAKGVIAAEQLGDEQAVRAALEHLAGVPPSPMSGPRTAAARPCCRAGARCPARPARPRRTPARSADG